MSTRAAALPHPLYLLLLLSLALGLAALPTPVGAAKGDADNVDFGVTALTERVSDGGILAVEATFTYSGKSTLTNFRFDGAATNATLLDAPPPCGGVLNVPGAVRCSFGNVTSPTEIRLVILMNADVDDVVFTGSFSSDARRGTGPAVNLWSDQVAIDVDPSEGFYGSWVRGGEAPTFDEVFTIGQRTHVGTRPFPDPYAASIEHTSSRIVCEETDVGGFGETVEVSVANGQAPIVVTMTYSGASAAGKSPGKVAVVHQADSAPGSDPGSCSFPPPNCRVNRGFCYDASWSGGGPNKALVIRVELPWNGKIKGI